MNPAVLAAYHALIAEDHCYPLTIDATPAVCVLRVAPSADNARMNKTIAALRFGWSTVPGHWKEPKAARQKKAVRREMAHHSRKMNRRR